MAARTILLGGASAVTAGYGVYAVSQYQTVSALSKEETDVRKLIEGEQRKAKTTAAAITTEQANLEALQKKVETTRKGSAGVDAKVAAARKALEQAQAEQQKQQDELRKAETDLKSAVDKLGQLRGDVERSKEAVTMAERTLSMVSGRRREAEKLYNPLNHPKVKSLMGKK